MRYVLPTAPNVLMCVKVSLCQCANDYRNRLTFNYVIAKQNGAAF